jgi:hypothetical protein
LPRYRNPVFTNLKKKATQLKEAGFNGVNGVFICDAGCESLRMHTEEIVQAFFRQHPGTVAFVVAVDVPDQSTSSRLRARTRISWNPSGIHLRSRSATEAALRRFVEAMPRPERSSWHGSEMGLTTEFPRGFAGTHRSDAGPTGERIRVSARAVVEALGRASPERNAPLPAEVFQVFRALVGEGRMLTTATLEPQHHHDDDWLVLEFGEPDAAISPFRVPRRANKDRDQGSEPGTMTSTAPPSTAQAPRALGVACDCVIDTNVALELYSLHDLTTLYDERHAAHGDKTENLAEVVHRRTRAADTLALAIALHEKRATSFQLVNEVIRILTARVLPRSGTFEAAYTQLFIHYIKDYCLPDWSEISDTQLGLAAKGTDCDTILLEVARDNGIALVTNEGNNVDGVDDSHGLRGRARAAGVRVFTPGEYVATLGVSFPKASVAFAERFKTRQAEYLAKRPIGDHANVQGHLDLISKVYRWCFEATARRTSPT